MSLRPAKYNFHIWRGSTLQSRIIVYQDEDMATVKNLTGYTATFIVKDVQTQDVLLSLSSGSGITLGGSEGTIDLYLSEAATAALDWNYGLYELALIDSASNRDVYLWGSFKISGIA